MQEIENDLAIDRLLLTNDDGINSKGFKVLEAIAKEIAKEVWIFAPCKNFSGASHSVTFKKAIFVQQLDERKFSVDGTPSDCVLIALGHFLMRTPPTLTLVGLNHGENVGQDIIYSGTIGAAMESSLLGVPSVALSQEFKKNEKMHWKTPLELSKKIIGNLYKYGQLKGDVCFSINFPNLPIRKIRSIELTKQGHFEAALEQKILPCKTSENHYWIHKLRSSKSATVETSDTFHFRRDSVTITPLSFNLTHQTAYEATKKSLSNEIMNSFL